MLDCKGCQTPMSSTKKLIKDKGAMFENPSLYRSLVGSLQYVTLTRPEIAFTVNKLSQFLACPSVFHWQACKRVLRYLQNTTNYGLQFYSSGSLNLTAFSYADWGSDLDDRRSVGRYCVYLGNSLISWSSKKQHIVSRSIAESEYRALALAAAEVLWITYLLKELKMSLQQTPVIHCDNKSAEALASNPKYHSTTKHIGYTYLSTSCGSSLHLHDILYVPQLTKNLISISKLLENTNLIIEFVANMCFIKDKKREVHLAQRIARGGLYQLLSKNDFVSNSCNLTYGPRSMLSIFNNSTCNHSDSAENKACIPQCHTNTVKSIMSANLFHQHFGHPSRHVLKCILSSLSLNCNVTMPDFCDACQYGKMHQLPFYSTGINTKAPLELIHTDLWGPTPLPSSNGYRYYISFVDDYIRYCWIFPLTLKSEALDTFKFFKNLVEKQIGCPVKALQSDWGGEYRNFQ